MNERSADPLGEYRRVNVEGTRALSRQATKAGARRLLFLSSIKVNGEETPRDRGFRESDPAMPRDAYGASKSEAESALLADAASGGMSVTIVRAPLVYGAGVKGNFHTMARWLERGTPLPLGAVHSNRRSLLGLDNLISFMVMCVDHPAARNEIFLASDGEDLSTTDLLRRTARALGVRARLVPVPVPILVTCAALVGKRNVAQRLCGSLLVDAAKARRLLGWQPPLSVDEGLLRAAAWLRADARGR